MSKISWKPAAIMGPVPPALVSVGTMNESNILTIAWTGIINSDPPKTYISVRPERYSYDIIKKTGEFVINIPTSHIVRSIDTCGVKSGKDIDKFKLCGLGKEIATEVKCPLVAQSPINIECKVFDVIELGSHHMFLADIVAVDVDDQYIDEKGKFHIEKCSLASYAHGIYFAQGKKIGSFGYSVKKHK